jgi:predicted phosphate transport protein (TIGR00153 family)
MFNLKPKDNVFFELFSKGAEIFNTSAKELKLIMNELDNPEARLDKLLKLEHEGDLVTHELIEYTKKMFITPLDREDIFNITKGIDNITDGIESTANLFYMYNVTSATPEAIELVDNLVTVTSDLVTVISELKSLSKSTLLMKKIIEINIIENEADLVYRKAMRNLFENPEDLLSVMKWKDLYHNLENGIDACEALANEIRGVVLKYA